MPAPACLSSVISVGAVYDADVGSVSRFGCTDSSTAPDQVACWSSSNAFTDLLAPGAPVTSSGLGGGTSTFYGTSQASALAAACAAALLEANPIASPDGLEAALKGSATQLVDPKNALAFPRLDCATALEAVLHQPVPALGGGGSALAAALLIGAGLWQIWRRPGGYWSELRVNDGSFGTARRTERSPQGEEDTLQEGKSLRHNVFLQFFSCPRDSLTDIMRALKLQRKL